MYYRLLNLITACCIGCCRAQLELKRQQAFKGQHGAKLALGTVEKEPGKDESTGLPGAQQGAPATIMLDSLQQGEPATMAQTGQKGSGEPAMQHGGVSSEAGQHARSIDASTTVRGMDEVHKKRARRALSLLEESIAAANYACDDGTEISIDKVNDNFCDCPDGSDEPGILHLTSVDTNLKFRRKHMSPYWYILVRGPDNNTGAW